MKAGWIEAGIVAGVWMVSAVIVGVIVVAGHASEGSMTLATSILVGAGVASNHVRSAIAAAWLTQSQTEIKTDLQANTKVCEEVKTIANGNSDKRAAEARAAGSAETKAEVLAAVAVLAPEIMPAVVDKMPTTAKEEKAYQRGREDEKADSKF